MKLTITKDHRSAPVTILSLEGSLDGTNYTSLVKEAQIVYAAGVRDIILDLGKLDYLSSAGLVALHRVGLLFRGEENPEQDEGWAAYHALDRDRDSGIQEHVKLAGPTGNVLQVLEMVGFTVFFGIYPDLHQAESSFLTLATTKETYLP